MSEFDMRGLNRALSNLAAESKKTRQDIVFSTARGFVRNVVEITPPGSAGVKGQAAKKQGEMAILSDLNRIFRVTPGGGDSISLSAFHAANRNAPTGRTFRIKAPEKERVRRGEFLAYVKKVQARVGWLAAGWNASAAKLGVRLPAWVKRHGTSRGSAQVVTTAFSFRLILTNAVAFIGNLADYERRIQWSINYQATKLQRQADFLIKKSLKKAGF